MIGPLTTCVSVATLLFGMLGGSPLAKVQDRLHIIIIAIVFPFGTAIVILPSSDR